MSKPKYLEDINKAASAIPFGDLDVRITRHRSKVSKITVRKDAKIQPTSNLQAFSDLEKLINTLITANFEGKLVFGLEFKGGTIKEIVIKNKEVKNYG